MADASGRVVGIGRGAAFQMGVWAVVMDHVVAKWEGRLEPDDILLTNDPYGGMGQSGFRAEVEENLRRLAPAQLPPSPAEQAAQ